MEAKAEAEEAEAMAIAKVSVGVIGTMAVGRHIKACLVRQAYRALMLRCHGVAGRRDCSIICSI